MLLSAIIALRNALVDYDLNVVKIQAVDTVANLGASTSGRRWAYLGH